MLNDLYSKTEKKMTQGVDAAKRDLGQLRTGRASVSILDGVMVDYYGTATPIAQTAKLSVPEPGLIVAQPFDPTMIGAIEKAIKAADLGFNPANDGKLVRIPVPPLTEERRKQLVKKVGQIVEDGKTAVRGARREANDAVKKLEKDGDVSEDEARRALEKIQKLTDDYTKKVDDLGKSKEKELMEF
jgi:ribosome recycling factor